MLELTDLSWLEELKCPRCTQRDCPNPAAVEIQIVSLGEVSWLPRCLADAGERYVRRPISVPPHARIDRILETLRLAQQLESEYGFTVADLIHRLRNQEETSPDVDGASGDVGGNT